MIPRYQRILYWLLVAGIVAVTVVLVRAHREHRRQLMSTRDQSPISAPTDEPPHLASIASASDEDGTVSLDQVSLALPHDPALQARALLNRMFADFASPGSLHPLPAISAVTDVFLVPLPLKIATAAPGFTVPVAEGRRVVPPTPATSPYGLSHPAGAQLAVVNLSGAFADAHPSGVESEQLTLQAAIATLQANLPHVDEVLFLVDGKSRPTLNGHADISRPFSVIEPTRMIHVLSPDGTPQ